MAKHIIKILPPSGSCSNFLQTEGMYSPSPSEGQVAVYNQLSRFIWWWWPGLVVTCWSRSTSLLYIRPS